MREGTINRVFRSSFPEAEHSRFRTNAWAFGIADTQEGARWVEA